MSETAITVIYHGMSLTVLCSVAVSFIGGGNRSAQRKPQVTDKLYYIMLYTSP